jgi:type IV pilus assembly protein PilC
MKFLVKAINAAGTPYTVTIDAKDRAELYEQFHSRGEAFISATEARESPLLSIFSFMRLFASGVKLHEKIIFAKNLSAMLGAGLALSKALSVLDRQTKNKKFKAVIAALNEEIRRGGTLSSGLSKYPAVFPAVFTSMVKAGEESGGLVQALNLVAEQMDKSYLLIKKVRGAMIYPSIIFCVMIAIGVLMLIYVVPTLSSTFKELNVPLPATTRFVVSLSDFLSNHTILSLFMLLAVVAFFVVFGKLKSGKRLIDFFSTRIPLIGTIVKEVNSARTARTLSSLLSAGVDVVRAISITGEVIQNSFYKEVLEKAATAIQKGSPISGIFLENENLYPPLVGEMISVGEETGALSDMLLKLAEFYESEVDQKTKDLSTVIEPFMMIFIGAAVGFFAIAMIAPTYSLVNVIN